MKKFSTPIILVLAIVTAFAVSNWRSSRTALNTVTAELTTTSNKLSEVTAKLAELGAINETMRAQLTFHKTDLANTSNQVQKVAGQLAKATGERRELENQIAARAGELAASNRTNAQLRTAISQLESQQGSLRAEIDSTRVQLAEEKQRLEVANQNANRMEAQKFALMQKLVDASWLRIQLDKINAAAPIGSASNPYPLKLQPDGTVTFQQQASAEVPKKK